MFLVTKKYFDSLYILTKYVPGSLNVQYSYGYSVKKEIKIIGNNSHGAFWTKMMVKSLLAIIIQAIINLE